MSKIIITICFVFAALISGCQDKTSPDSGVVIKTSTETISLAQQNPPVMAYYFHRTMRCPTCLAIEAAAERTIERSFADQIAEEKLIWMAINLDEPEGKAFKKEFELSASTLVLSKAGSDNQIKYKKLEKVWQFIGDPIKFESYLQNEVKQFLDE